MTNRARFRTPLVVLSVLAPLLQAVAEPTPPRQVELRNLLLQDCGSCHGLTMRGGLGPPLTPAALTGKPAIVLREIILHGRPGTPMPPWAPFLTPDEALWLAQELLKGEISAQR